MTCVTSLTDEDRHALSIEFCLVDLGRNMVAIRQVGAGWLNVEM